MTLDYWRKNVDNLLTFQDKDILQGKGSVTNAEAEEIVRSRYDIFNAKRKQLDAQVADAEDIKMLEDLERSIIKKDRNDIVKLLGLKCYDEDDKKRADPFNSGVLHDSMQQ